MTLLGFIASSPGVNTGRERMLHRVGASIWLTGNAWRHPRLGVLWGAVCVRGNHGYCFVFLLTILSCFFFMVLLGFVSFNHAKYPWRLLGETKKSHLFLFFSLEAWLRTTSTMSVSLQIFKEDSTYVARCHVMEGGFWPCCLQRRHQCCRISCRVRTLKFPFGEWPQEYLQP